MTDKNNYHYIYFLIDKEKNTNHPKLKENEILVKIGSTLNIKIRMQKYQTNIDEFDDDHYCLIIYEFKQIAHYTCLYIDKLLNILCTKYNQPFIKYIPNKHGGHEFYIMNSSDRILEIFKKLNIDVKKKVLSIDDLMNEVGVYNKRKEQNDENDDNDDNDENFNNVVIDENDIIKFKNYDLKKIEIIEKFELRQWQQKSYNNCEKNFFNKTQNTGIITAPTGSGKSDLMIYIAIQFIINKKKDVM